MSLSEIADITIIIGIQIPLFILSAYVVTGLIYSLIKSFIEALHVFLDRSNK